MVESIQHCHVSIQELGGQKTIAKYRLKNTFIYISLVLMVMIIIFLEKVYKVSSLSKMYNTYTIKYKNP